jgi:hypothetical protein
LELLVNKNVSPVTSSFFVYGTVVYLTMCCDFNFRQKCACVSANCMAIQVRYLHPRQLF